MIDGKINIMLIKACLVICEKSIKD
jgi:hypothetical protein